MECNLIFQSYKELIIHTQTFCRRVVHGDNCTGCFKEKQKCQCGFRFKTIMQQVNEWLKSNKNFHLKEVFLSVILQVAVQKDYLKQNIQCTEQKEPEKNLQQIFPRIESIIEGVMISVYDSKI